MIPDPENHLPDLEFIKALRRSLRSARRRPGSTFPACSSPPTPLGRRGPRRGPGGRNPVESVFPAKSREGRWLAGPGEVVLGREIARRIDARVGEQVVLSAASLAGQQAMGLEVVGFAATGVVAVDETAVLVTLEDAKRLTGVPTATTVALDVPRGSEASVAGRVQAPSRRPHCLGSVGPRRADQDRRAGQQGLCLPPGAHRLHLCRTWPSPPHSSSA